MKESSWASTLAKLLAALVAVLVSPHPSPGKVMPSQLTVLRGGVGNKAIDTLGRMERSTRDPFLLVLMEYCQQRDCQHLCCVLDLHPRVEMKRRMTLRMVRMTSST